MLDQVNIRQIIDHHYKTVKKPKTVIAICGIFALLLICFIKPLSNDILIGLITAYSVFVALLLNLLLLVFDIIKRLNEKPDSIYDKNNNIIKSREDFYKLKKQFTNEVYCNISFAILVALTLVIASIILSLKINWSGSPVWLIHIITEQSKDLGDKLYQVMPIIIHIKNIIKYALNWFIYFFSMIFVYTLYMILRRIHFLLIKETEK